MGNSKHKTFLLLGRTSISEINTYKNYQTNMIIITAKGSLNFTRRLHIDLIYRHCSSNESKDCTLKPGDCTLKPGDLPANRIPYKEMSHMKSIKMKSFVFSSCQCHRWSYHTPCK